MNKFDNFEQRPLCPKWAENWKLVNEIHYKAMPEYDIPASTVKTYVDVDSIEKHGSIREYWVKSVEYDFGKQKSFTLKTYAVFDCANNRGATKIYANGRVVPDHKLQWFPVCTGNEPPPEHIFDIRCLLFHEHKFICSQ